MTLFTREQKDAILKVKNRLKIYVRMDDVIKIIYRYRVLLIMFTFSGRASQSKQQKQHIHTHTHALTHMHTHNLAHKHTIHWMAY